MLSKHTSSVDTGHRGPQWWAFWGDSIKRIIGLWCTTNWCTDQQRRSDTGLTCSSISNSTVLLGKRTGNVWPESLNWVATIANVIVIVDQTQPTIRPPTLGCVTCGTQSSDNDKCSDSNICHNPVWPTSIIVRHGSVNSATQLYCASLRQSRK